MADRRGGGRWLFELTKERHMASAKDLDSVIRAKAEADWERAVFAGFARLGTDLGLGYLDDATASLNGRDANFYGKDGARLMEATAKIKARHLLHKAESAFLAFGKARAGDLAVAAFIKKVDSLQDQIDEVRTLAAPE
jgi:hypothetical protein